MDAVHTFGWPSRVRGDYGTENNDIERKMIQRWGEDHHAYIRGRQVDLLCCKFFLMVPFSSTHNQRIEQLWRDIRKDCLELFRRIFLHLEEQQLLDMDNAIHRVCLYHVFFPRIQESLERACFAWNNHQIRTEQNRTAIILFELSRTELTRIGKWTGDPGDENSTASHPHYGVDGEGPLPPAEEILQEATEVQEDWSMDEDIEKENGVRVNGAEELTEGLKYLAGFDLAQDDGNFGIHVFPNAVAHFIENFKNM
jgi:hypothetical protein